MIELDIELPKGALLNALGNALSKQETMQIPPPKPQLAPEARGMQGELISFLPLPSAFVMKDHEHVASWIGQGARAEITTSNESGTGFVADVGLEFQDGKNCGLHCEGGIAQANKVSLAMLYSRGVAAVPRTLFCLNLDRAKTWMSVLDYGNDWAVAEKKHEKALKRPEAEEVTSPILLEMEIEKNLVRMRIALGEIFETALATEEWDGGGDLFIGARNHNPGPANSLGAFYLHGLWLKNNSLALSENDGEWRESLSSAMEKLQNGL